MPASEVNIEGLLDKNGNPLSNTDSPQVELLGRNTNHVCWTKLETTTTPTSYLCDRAIVANTVTISPYTSIAETVLVYPEKTKIADYDTLYGIDFNAYTTGRQFLLITDEDGVDDASLPDNGSSYPLTRAVIFSGYNKKGAELDLNNVREKIKWIGVENLLDEITISGCYTKNIITKSWPAGSEGLNAWSSQNCVFNERGRGDKSTVLNVGEISTERFFNKSGIKDAATWSLADIFRYVVQYYTFATTKLIYSYSSGVDLIPYISRYIDCDFRDIDNTDLASITPYDFSLEGLGVLEAIIKIFEESKNYTLYKAYTADGKVTLTYRNKASDTINKGAGDKPMLINIGALDAVPDSTILFNEGNISLNRDTKNIGRVVVMGDYLRINTLATTLAYTGSTAKFSTNGSTYSVAGGITDFAEHISLDITDTRFLEKYEQVYIASSRNVLGLAISGLGVDVSASGPEDTRTKIFDILKPLKISRFLDQGTITPEGKNLVDIAVYVAEPSEPEKRSFFEESNIYPTKYVSPDTFYFITPISNDTVGMDAKLDSSNYSGIFISGRDLTASEDTGRFPFEEYVYNSELPLSDLSSLFPNGAISNPAPVFARINIQTDYRIKGIAEVADFSSNKELYETVFLYDNDFKLSLQHKDATYAEGSFTALTDGYINASDVAVLQKIKEKADSLLDKYRVIQNSGAIKLDGVQYYLKVGDWFNKLTGTGRDINTPSNVAKIIFDFQEKTTLLTLGT